MAVSKSKNLEEARRRKFMKKMDGVLRTFDKQRKSYFSEPTHARIHYADGYLEKKEKKLREKKIYEKAFDELREGTREREKQQIGLYEQYVDVINKIPDLSLSEEMKLAKAMYRKSLFPDTKIMFKIKEANLKYINPITASIVFGKEYKKAAPSRTELFEKWCLLTPLEMILYGNGVKGIGASYDPIYYRWSRTLSVLVKQNYRFSDFIENNEKYMKNVMTIHLGKIIGIISGPVRGTIFESYTLGELEN